ncbi:hypothetical protein E4665_12490 [Sporolactobacillus shoreae]|uniref:Uncharacterized protein n=1 Tax=Sporolactobacillus shoreae TaxID=1465501 RepID=A0A4Z0GK16_9BACL|nr:hypothetical protein [Sporolactobacillus shoreae]TGA97211.1 hypothetical protein E4665_12490 [Sporolactobacillus shoreae]
MEQTGRCIPAFFQKIRKYRMIDGLNLLNIHSDSDAEVRDSCGTASQVRPHSEGTERGGSRIARGKRATEASPEEGKTMRITGF